MFDRVVLWPVFSLSTSAIPCQYHSITLSMLHTHLSITDGVRDNFIKWQRLWTEHYKRRPTCDLRTMICEVFIVVNSMGMILWDWHCIMRQIGNKPEDGGSRLLRKITLSDYTLNIVWITCFIFLCNGCVKINYLSCILWDKITLAIFLGTAKKILKVMRRSIPVKLFFPLIIFMIKHVFWGTNFRHSTDYSHHLQGDGCQTKE